MSKQLYTILVLIIPFFGFSEERGAVFPIWLIKDSVSGKIHPDSVRLVFKVEDFYQQLMLNQHSAIIQVKIDGQTKKYTISDQKRTFQVGLSKGKHQLDFFVNANFEEINLDNEFRGGHYYEYGLNFQGGIHSGKQIMVEKPVIYLYTANKESFRLKIKTDAELQFTYPAYKDEWKGTTSPDGTIQINGSNYPYLFWDASLPVEKLNLNWQESDQILGEQTIEYLSAQLDHLGFNPKEKSDFITYWGPRMQKLKYLEILWIQNESVNEIASLDISPAFTQNRIYILFKEISGLKDETLQLKFNELKPIDRTKNHLLEWGGIEIPSNL
ncbi:MAG: hypothetical protein ACO1N0_12915 [Fluviicola sp.]